MSLGNGALDVCAVLDEYQWLADYGTGPGTMDGLWSVYDCSKRLAKRFGGFALDFQHRLLLSVQRLGGNPDWFDRTGAAQRSIRSGRGIG